jgi:hypothetical protein
MEIEWKFRYSFSEWIWKIVCFGMWDSYIQLLLFAQSPHVYSILTSSCFGQATAIGTDTHLEHALLGHVAWESRELAA